MGTPDRGRGGEAQGDIVARRVRMVPRAHAQTPHEWTTWRYHPGVNGDPPRPGTRARHGAPELPHPLPPLPHGGRVGVIRTAAPGGRRSRRIPAAAPGGRRGRGSAADGAVSGCPGRSARPRSRWTARGPAPAEARPPAPAAGSLGKVGRGDVRPAVTARAPHRRDPGGAGSGPARGGGGRAWAPDPNHSGRRRRVRAEHQGRHWRCARRRGTATRDGRDQGGAPGLSAGRSCLMLAGSPPSVRATREVTADPQRVTEGWRGAPG
jgi:hypothetical protein